MKIKQLSLFIENKPGHLGSICADLDKYGINIFALSLADTTSFGILRLIVNDWEKAKTSLEADGHVVNMTEVVAVEVPNQPGGLVKVLDVIDTSGINIEYMYAFAGNPALNTAALIFRFDKPDKAVELLIDAGISGVDAVSVFE
jgi:hypothetical protein